MSELTRVCPELIIHCHLTAAMRQTSRLNACQTFAVRMTKYIRQFGNLHQAMPHHQSREQIPCILEVFCVAAKR